jgi:CTP-dependent riboflavin kinase
MLLVAKHSAMVRAASEPNRAKRDKAIRDAETRQQIKEAMQRTGVAMTSTEFCNILKTPRQRIDRVLKAMCSDKEITRKRSASRRPDGEGFRSTFKYRLAK